MVENRQLSKWKWRYFQKAPNGARLAFSVSSIFLATITRHSQKIIIIWCHLLIMVIAGRIRRGWFLLHNTIHSGDPTAARHSHCALALARGVHLCGQALALISVRLQSHVTVSTLLVPEIMATSLTIWSAQKQSMPENFEYCLTLITRNLCKNNCIYSYMR